MPCLDCPVVRKVGVTMIKCGHRILTNFYVLPVGYNQGSELL